MLRILIEICVYPTNGSDSDKETNFLLQLPLPGFQSRFRHLVERQDKGLNMLVCVVESIIHSAFNIIEEYESLSIPGLQLYILEPWPVHKIAALWSVTQSSSGKLLLP